MKLSDGAAPVGVLGRRQHELTDSASIPDFGRDRIGFRTNRDVTEEG